VVWRAPGAGVEAADALQHERSRLNRSIRPHARQDYLRYLRDSHQYVEKVHQLEKGGGFEGEGTPESREFIRRRIAAGSQMPRACGTAPGSKASGPAALYARETRFNPDSVKSDLPMHNTPQLGQPTASQPGI